MAWVSRPSVYLLLFLGYLTRNDGLVPVLNPFAVKNLPQVQQIYIIFNTGLGDYTNALMKPFMCGFMPASSFTSKLIWRLLAAESASNVRS